MKKKIDEIKPEDAIPLLIRLRKYILGKKKPDGFTRLMFGISMFSWVFLAFWNTLSYFVLISSDVIESNKGFSVNEILIKNGRNLGFEGEEFLFVIKDFYFYTNFLWLIVLLGLVLMYRKKKTYTLFALGGLGLHFSYLFFVLGIQYFIEDVSFFDKILYGVLIVAIIIHSALMKKEKDDMLSPEDDPILED